MNFFDLLKSSVYNPRFYATLPTLLARRSFFFFIKLALLLTVVATVSLGVQTLPSVTQFLSRESLERLVNYFPADLELKVKDGRITSNDVGPRFIDVPGISRGENKDEHLIVIDTTRSIDLNAFKEYRTAIWVASDGVVTQQKDKITINTAQSIPNFTVNQSTIHKFVDVVHPYLKFIPLVFIVIIFIFTFLLHCVYLLYLLLLALLIMLIGKMRGVSLSYGLSYQTGLHAMSLGLIVDLLFSIIPGFVGSIPFLFTALTLLAAAANIKPPTQSQSAESPPPAPSA